LATNWNVETGENIRWHTPLPGLAHDTGAAIMGLGNAANNGEPEADPRGLAAPRAFLSNPSKFLKQARLVFRRNPRPAVTNFDAHEGPILHRPYNDGAARICVLDRVGKVVRQGLAKQTFDTLDSRQRIRQLHSQALVLLLGSIRVVIDRRAQGGEQIHRCHHGVEALGFQVSQNAQAAQKV